jgi:hypothetical protein
MAAVAFDTTYDPQAVLRSRDALPEERAAAEASQQLRAAINIIQRDLEVLLTPDMVEFLRTQRPTESPHQHRERMAIHEEHLRRRWADSGCDYQRCLARHNVVGIDGVQFAESMEQQFLMKRDEVISAALRERLSVPIIAYPAEQRTHAEYGKTRSLEVVGHNNELARLYSTLAESKAFFREMSSIEDMKDIDVERWIAYAYEMAPPLERRQFDELSKTCIAGRPRAYLDAMLAITAGAFGTAIFSLTPDGLAIGGPVAGCAALVTNFAARLWLTKEYNNLVQAALDTPKEELKSDLSFGGALLWTGLLFKVVRDMNPSRLYPDRTAVLNSQYGWSARRILSTLVQTADTLHKHLEIWLDEAVDRSRNGSHQSITDTVHQARIATQQLEAIREVMGALRARWLNKGSLSFMATMYSGIAGGFFLAGQWFGGGK